MSAVQDDALKHSKHIIQIFQLSIVIKEERLERQRDGVLQRIGEQILSRHATNRKAAVRLIGHVNDALGKYEQIEPGQIKESHFKECIKQLELGISAGQQVDLCKACSSKESI